MLFLLHTKYKVKFIRNPILMFRLSQRNYFNENTYDLNKDYTFFISEEEETKMWRRIIIFIKRKGWRIFKKIRELMRLLYEEKNIRNISCFLVVNMLFGFTELFFGLSTNSLGMISDAFHMFFDCTGLVIGLIASWIARWTPNEDYSFGYGRAEVLGSLINCIVLILVAFYIILESVERYIEPPEVKHERLFAVALIGLIINLGGLWVFGNHDGGSTHGHSHYGISQPANRSYEVNVGGNNSHKKKHSHKSHIQEGVLLHILADTLGSIGVMISSFLIENYGWMRADIVCSLVIAFLIFTSVYPLTKECFFILMQRQPASLKTSLTNCFRRLMHLEGVYRVVEPHFWTLNGNRHVGSVTLEVSKQSDILYILSESQNIFSNVGVHNVCVQLKYTVV